MTNPTDASLPGAGEQKPLRADDFRNMAMFIVPEVRPLFIAHADAIDAMETAVKGCGRVLYRDDGMNLIRCGDHESDDEPDLCTDCISKRESAISTLLGAPHER